MHTLYSTGSLPYCHFPAKLGSFTRDVWSHSFCLQPSNLANNISWLGDCPQPTSNGLCRVKVVTLVCLKGREPPPLKPEELLAECSLFSLTQPPTHSLSLSPSLPTPSPHPPPTHSLSPPTPSPTLPTLLHPLPLSTLPPPTPSLHPLPHPPSTHSPTHLVS